jgi:hypothetical protein
MLGMRIFALPEILMLSASKYEGRAVRKQALEAASVRRKKPRGANRVAFALNKPRAYFRSKRSAFITLVQAAAKSFANFSFASAAA